ncbi:hypothetical protein AO1008_09907 [Aspergillus oryzae 100-8]|uniref:Amino acid transporter transmembrane domain-containing protein n=1 Tax=Aspergillus oryzae (strain 3.042) TaxID=1160506 RepID=I8U2I1_ASPO3|nr:hypothetical protein Ao3042_02497 [Aspergillus oryzae 3.042]KDE83336.1 hypothetical protein AO1008_09907 [Aspergillus oryzae 100-8]|eukprot:EIT80970.1 hypothetical protein Ao3042_02497 [Aspergillus oryzae 3.042]
MVAETISLGILSLPAAIANLGFVPAIIILISLGLIASYTGYVIGQFKWRYPHISSMADAGEMLMGPLGRELLFVGQMLFLVFLMASHILTFTVAMNTLTNHGTCSIVFGIVGLIVSLLMSLPRTLAKMSWLSLAYFPKALSLLQCIDISLYLVCGVVIYRYAGEGVESPALGSAGPMVGKIAYGIALPTILIAGVINGHIACKSIYTRVFAGTDRMHKRDFVAVGSWIGIAVALWVVAWVIASAIPVFSDLLSLMTALFASWFSFGLPGAFWLYMNKNLWFSSPKKILLTLFNTLCICIGIVMCGLGLYSSGKAIHDNPSSQSFSCANTA